MSYGSIISMSVDTHFHIFYKNAINRALARYTVSSSAPLNEWFTLSRAQGITHGVIVQPSFLGTDNTYLLDAIRQFPSQLKGVGVVDPLISKDALRILKTKGMSGIRLNLSEEPNPLTVLEMNQGLMTHLIDLDMHLQIHHDDGLLNTLLSNLPQGLKIVVDHFGRPKSNSEFLNDHAGIDRHNKNLWVKLSAPYRTPHLDHGALFQYWLNKIGPERLLWGSDWPHTRFESQQNYANQMQQFQLLCQDPALKDQILTKNPMALYWH